MTKKKSRETEEELKKLKSTTQRLIDETSILKSLLIQSFDNCKCTQDYDCASSMSCHLQDRKRKRMKSN